jgi:hypothetical protein
MSFATGSGRRSPFSFVFRRHEQHMPSVSSLLVAAGSLGIFGLGCAHLLFTFRGNKLHPRDPTLMDQMREVSPVISREMSMWNAWVGFNASHSFGAMLFGLVYSHLALVQPAVLFSSWFLRAGSARLNTQRPEISGLAAV